MNSAPTYTNNPRTPFVEIFLNGEQIPLLDASGIGTSKGFLLNSFSYSRKPGGGFVGNTVEISIIDPTWDTLTDLLVALKSNMPQQLGNFPTFGFKFGWRGIDDVEGKIILQMFIQRWDVKFTTFGGAIIDILGQDQGFILNFPYTGAFVSTTPISTAISTIITAAGLVPDVELTSNTVGEHGTVAGNQTGFQYINHLMKLAISTKGNVGYSIYVDNSVNPQVVRVRPPQGYPIIGKKKYVFGRGRDSEVLEFSPQYNFGLAVGLGAGKAVAMGTDGATKSPIVESSVRSESSDVGGGLNTTRTPPLPAKVYETPWSSIQDIKAWVSRRREIGDYANFTATALVWGDTSINPFDYVHFDILKGGKANNPLVSDILETHEFSGWYQIIRVNHMINAGMFRTSFDMYRMSGSKGTFAEVQTIKVINAVIPPQLRDFVTAKVASLPEEGK